MNATKPIVADCQLCENRRVVCIGPDDHELACPRCNAWCTLCLEQSQRDSSHHPRLGVLLAAVRRITAGLELLEGYLCDEHKRLFQSCSSIAPAMIGQFRPGSAYITVQTLFQTHAFVQLYGYAEAENWRELEPDALLVTNAQPFARHGPHRHYPCPTDLAARALTPDWVAWKIGLKQDRSVLAGGALLSTWQLSAP